MKFKTRTITVRRGDCIFTEEIYTGAVPRFLQWVGIIRPPHEVGEFKPREGWLIEDQLVLTGTCIEAVPRWFPRLRDWASQAIAWIKARLEPVPEPPAVDDEDDEDSYW